MRANLLCGSMLMALACLCFAATSSVLGMFGSWIAIVMAQRLAAGEYAGICPEE